MTTENIFNLAKNGKLGRDLDLKGYCVSAAIDACFTAHSVPVEVYDANYTAVMNGEIDNEGAATDRFYELLGSLAFKSSSPEELNQQPYYFADLEELRADLGELRNQATILLDTTNSNGMHSVGLKPAGDNPDEWQIVGAHQLVASLSAGKPMDVTGMITPNIINTEQVWEYLRANNPPDIERQTALIFPPEPHLS